MFTYKRRLFAQLLTKRVPPSVSDPMRLRALYRVTVYIELKLCAQSLFPFTLLLAYYSVNISVNVKDGFDVEH